MDKKIKLYTVRDDKAVLCIPPFTFPNNAVATRSFSDIVKDGKSQYALHPEDYSLWFIGEFDTETMEIVSCVPTKLCQASDFVVSQ